MTKNFKTICIFIIIGIIISVVINLNIGFLKLDFTDFVDAMAGLLCAVFIVLTCNIVTGIMLGFSALVIGRLATAAARYAKAQGFADDGYRIVMNCNGDGGQTVFQIHLHLLAGAPLGRFGTP